MTKKYCGIPTLCSLQKHEGQAPQDHFRDFYMALLTEEFGDDLDALRKVGCVYMVFSL